jgi:hypothetical protein
MVKNYSGTSMIEGRTAFFITGDVKNQGPGLNFPGLVVIENET